MGYKTLTFVNKTNNVLYELAEKPIVDESGKLEVDFIKSMPGEYYYMVPYIKNCVTYAYLVLANLSEKVDTRMSFKRTITVSFCEQMVNATSIFSHNTACAITHGMALSHANNDLAETNLGFISIEQLDKYDRIVDEIRKLKVNIHQDFILDIISASILNLRENIDLYNSSIAKNQCVGTVPGNMSKVYQV